MTFVIERASLMFDDEKKPCKEAEKRSYVHEYINGQGIQTCWVVEINSLNDLMKLVKKYGKIIIEEQNEYVEYKHDGYLLIYDDYIE